MKEKSIYPKTEKEIKQLDKVLEEELRHIRQSALDDAYMNSPEEYNRLFDSFQRADRESRKQEGTYTLDDFLDELEEKRETKNKRKLKR